MTAWESYIHSTTAPDRLVQLAILHAEFEALHPFLDGNGRLGRMLVPLFLWQVDLDPGAHLLYERLSGISPGRLLRSLIDWLSPVMTTGLTGVTFF